MFSLLSLCVSTAEGAQQPLICLPVHQMFVFKGNLILRESYACNTPFIFKRHCSETTKLLRDRRL